MTTAGLSERFRDLIPSAMAPIQRRVSVIEGDDVARRGGLGFAAVGLDAAGMPVLDLFGLVLPYAMPVDLYRSRMTFCAVSPTNGRTACVEQRSTRKNPTA
ncbi:MAG: hypothetical protein R6U98_23445 [Pirellulaceae bacterium]